MYLIKALLFHSFAHWRATGGPAVAEWVNRDSSSNNNYFCLHLCLILMSTFHPIQRNQVVTVWPWTQLKHKQEPHHRPLVDTANWERSLINQTHTQWWDFLTSKHPDHTQLGLFHHVFLSPPPGTGLQGPCCIHVHLPFNIDFYCVTVSTCVMLMFHF